MDFRARWGFPRLAKLLLGTAVVVIGIAVYGLLKVIQHLL